MRKFIVLFGIVALVTVSGVSAVGATDNTNWNETDIFQNQSHTLDYMNNSSESGFVLAEEQPIAGTYVFLHENNTIDGKDAHAIAEFLNYTSNSDFNTGLIGGDRIKFEEMVHLGFAGSYEFMPVSNGGLNQLNINTTKYGEYTANVEELVIDLTHPNASFDSGTSISGQVEIYEQTFFGSFTKDLEDTIPKQSTFLVVIATIALIVGVVGIVKDFEQH